MQRKPGILSHVFFVVFVATWIAVLKRLLGTPEFTMGQLAFAALGAAFFGAVGVGLGLWIDSKRKGGS